MVILPPLGAGQRGASRDQSQGSDRLNPFTASPHPKASYKRHEKAGRKRNMSKLKDKVAIVTGASKGIGASIAKHLADEGAAVVVNYASSKEAPTRGRRDYQQGRKGRCRAGQRRETGGDRPSVL
jgi:hypothetical protein